MPTLKASLHIQTAQRQGITYLKQSYFTPPFKVANITEDKKAQQLHLMLMCSSPGILDGDDYTMKIDVAEACCLQLHTQSYQRLFNMKAGAQQLMEVHLKDGASFTYLPHPSVPHHGSSFTAHNKIYLTNNNTLLWGEVLTCGRRLNGEEFQFSKYHNITEVYLNNKLVIKENLLMQPSLIDVTAIGQLEQYTHQASFICIMPNIRTDELTDGIHEYLEQQEGLLSAVTTGPQNSIIVRALGYKAEQLHDCLKAITKLVSHRFAN